MSQILVRSRSCDIGRSAGSSRRQTSSYRSRCQTLHKIIRNQHYEFLKQTINPSSRQFSFTGKGKKLGQMEATQTLIIGMTSPASMPFSVRLFCLVDSFLDNQPAVTWMECGPLSKTCAWFPLYLRSHNFPCEKQGTKSSMGMSNYYLTSPFLILQPSILSKIMLPTEYNFKKPFPE